MRWIAQAALWDLLNEQIFVVFTYFLYFFFQHSWHCVLTGWGCDSQPTNRGFMLRSSICLFREKGHVRCQAPLIDVRPLWRGIQRRFSFCFEDLWATCQCFSNRVFSVAINASRFKYSLSIRLRLGTIALIETSGQSAFRKRRRNEATSQHCSLIRTCAVCTSWRKSRLCKY